MLVYIPMLNLVNSGTASYFLNIQTLHFNYLVKLSYSFISSNTPDYDADFPHGNGNPYKTIRIGLHDKLLNLTLFLRLHGFRMLLLHFLDTLVIFLLNVAYIFLQFFLYKQLSHSSSNFTKQYLLNIILKTILLCLVL